MGTPAEVLQRVLERLISVIVAARGSAPEFDANEIAADDAS
jgi:hypothetical protein